jgi:hypothetical protein
MAKYLDVHGAAPRREKMIKTGLELLKQKADERKGRWQHQIQDRKDKQEAEIQRLELEKSLKASKQAIKARKFKVLEDAATKDAHQQVPQCDLDEKESMVRRAGQVKAIFHFFFSFSTVLIVSGLGMFLYAHFIPLAQQRQHQDEMMAEIFISGKDDNNPQGHYKDWMVDGTRPEDAVSMDYYL